MKTEFVTYEHGYKYIIVGDACWLSYCVKDHSKANDN